MQPSSNVVSFFALLMFLVASSSLAFAASLDALDSPAAASIVDLDARKLEKDVSKLVGNFEEVKNKVPRPVVQKKNKGPRSVGQSVQGSGDESVKRAQEIKKKAMFDFYGSETEEAVQGACLDKLAKKKKNNIISKCYGATIFSKGDMPYDIAGNMLQTSGRISDNERDTVFNMELEFNQIRRNVLRIISNSGKELTGFTHKARRYFKFGLPTAEYMASPKQAENMQCVDIIAVFEMLEKFYENYCTEVGTDGKRKFKEENQIGRCDHNTNAALIQKSSNSHTDTYSDDLSLGHLKFVKNCLIFNYLPENNGNQLNLASSAIEAIEEFNRMVWLRYFARTEIKKLVIDMYNSVDRHIQVEIHRYFSLNSNEQINRDLLKLSTATGEGLDTFQLDEESNTDYTNLYEKANAESLRLDEYVKTLREEIEKRVKDEDCPLPEDYILLPKTPQNNNFDVQFYAEDKFPTLHGEMLADCESSWKPSDSGSTTSYVPSGKPYGWVFKECGAHIFLWKISDKIVNELSSLEELREEMKQKREAKLAETRRDNIAAQMNRPPRIR